MAAGVVGVVWSVGDAMNWVEVEAHATVAGYTFTRTGTANVAISCCTVLQHHGWDLTGEVLVVVAAVVVPVAAALWSPSQVGAAALAGAALVLAAGPLSVAAMLNAPATFAEVGEAPVDVRPGGLLLSGHGLPGLWLALVAAVGMLLLAVVRAISGGDVNEARRSRLGARISDPTA
jgi:hypothetical protein